MEEVKSCHVQCGHDFACHKACPAGIFGRFKEQCAALDAASACHKACVDSKTECPYKKHECHFKCPMSMPTSVKELRGITGHVLCHKTCGKDKACHKACPNSVWSEKMEQCKSYHNIMACHQSCGHSHICHANCPHMSEQMLKSLARAHKPCKRHHQCTRRMSRREDESTIACQLIRVPLLIQFLSQSVYCKL